MHEFFDTPSNRKIRKETKERAQYADSQTDPGLKDLMDQARSLFQSRVVDIADDVTVEDIEGIFDQCVKQVPGAQEAFEIWDKLFNRAEIT